MASNGERDAHFLRVHHLIWETYANMEIIADDVFAQSGLSNAIAGTLNLISSFPGATVAELSRYTPKSQQAISQLVAKLEKLGYVERRVGPGRGVRLHLTEAGQAAAATGERLEEEMEASLLEVFGPELYAVLSERLAEAVQRLSR